jgi:flagellar hook-associated protein 2
MAGEIFHPNITGAFDWGTLLDGLMKLESVRLQRLELQKSKIDNILKALRDLKSSLSELYDFTAGINKESWFSKKTFEVSNPEVADVSIINNDIPEYTAKATVSKVAQIEISYFSRVFSDTSEQFNPDNPDKEYHLRLQYNPVDGDHIEKVITFKGGDTLQDLIDKINKDPDIGKYLHAYTMFVGDGYRFAIMERDVAASTDESSAGGPYDSGELEEVLGDYYILQGAQNSELKVGDQSFTDPGYTFTNILPGLKVRVKNTGDFTVTIKRDYKGIADVFKELVNKVNNVIRKINELTDIKVNGNKVTGPKVSDYELKELKIKLQRLFYPLLEDPTAAKYNLIDYNENDGTVQLNLSNLQKFLEENPEDKWQILYDVVQNAKELSDLAINKAYLAPLIKGYEDMEKRIEERIEYYQQYLAEKEEFLKKRFASIETYIAGLQETQAKINSILTAQMLLSSV